MPLAQPTRVDGQPVRDLAAAHGRRGPVPPQLLDLLRLRRRHHRWCARQSGDRAASRAGDLGADLAFLRRGVWNASTNEFGILPEISTTARCSPLIGGFFGITVAIFLTQDFLPPRLAAVFRTIVEMLAAIPSVVYGLWGIFVVIPLIRPVANWLHEFLGFIPFFGTSLSGPGLFPRLGAGDHDPADGRRALAGRPAPDPLQGEGSSHGMGTRGGMRSSRSSCPRPAAASSAACPGLRRALGETMALAMLIGNANQTSLSLFAPANTLASLMASNFPEEGTERARPWRRPRAAGRDARREHHRLLAARPDPATGSELTMAATSLDAGLVRPSLDRSFTEGRAVSSLLLTIGAWLAVIVASIPLFSVLYMLIVRGALA